jgi:hypothetical protein
MKKVLLGILGLVVLIFALGFVLPDKVHSERSIVINAPPAAVFALVADLNEQGKWSPWAEYDPGMQSTVSGAGVGQKLSWTSTKMGSGSQTIAALNPPTRVDYALEFGDKGVATATMALEPVAEGTRATWSFDSNMRKGVPFLMKPMSTYMGFFMDGMLGKDYEKGLANLKRVAEAA